MGSLRIGTFQDSSHLYLLLPRFINTDLFHQPLTLSLSLVPDDEECLLYFFPRLFRVVSDHYPVHEFGLV